MTCLFIDPSHDVIKERPLIRHQRSVGNMNGIRNGNLQITASLCVIYMYTWTKIVTSIVFNCPFRSSKRNWALVYLLFKLHHIKKLIPSPERSHENE